MSPQKGTEVPVRKVSGLETSEEDEQQRAESFEFISADKCPAHLLREITDFLDSQNTSHPFQFPQWAGGKPYLALYRRQGRLCWFAQCGVFYPASRVLRSVRALAVNRGPVADDLDIVESGLRHLVDAATRNRFAFVEIIPEWSGSFAAAAGRMLSESGWQSTDEARTSLRVKLSGELEPLLASFRKVTRYEIRRCQKLSVEVTMATSEKDHEDWIRVYGEMAMEKDFAPEDFGHIRKVLRWLGTEPARGGLLLARKDSRTVGGIVIIRSGTRCWYVWGATAKDDKFSPGHLLQWRAIQWAKEIGCGEYDFCGYREGTQSGTAFFKRGFSDDVVTFSPASRYITNRSRQRTSEIVRRVSLRLQPFRKS